jgi:hypothetical protein
LATRAPKPSLLIVGWNDQVCWMLRELEASRGETWRVLVASSTPIDSRLEALRQAGIDLSHTYVEHCTIDPTAPHDLAGLPLLDYETLIVPASDRLESAEDADARSLLVYRLLRARLHELTKVERRILVELRDPANTGLFDGIETEPVPTSLLATHMLAQIALRPEVRPVFDALLAADGPEFAMLEPAALGMGSGESSSFADIMVCAAQRGVVVIGLQLANVPNNGGVVVNPKRSQKYALGERDRVIVLERGKRSEPQA